MSRDKLISDELRGKVVLVWGCAALAVVLVGAIVYGVIDWRATDNKRDKVYANVEKASENFLQISEDAKQITANFKDGSAQIKPMLEAAAAEFVSLKGFTDTTKGELSQTMETVRGRLLLIDPLLATIQGQIAQEGNTANDIIKHADDGLFGKDGTLPRINKSADHLSDIAVDAKASTAKLPSLIGNIDDTVVAARSSLFDPGIPLVKPAGLIPSLRYDTHVLIGTRIVDANGYVHGTGFVGVVEDFHGAVDDGRRFIHKTLFGPPCYKREDGTRRGFFSTIGNCAKGAAETGFTLGTKGAQAYRAFTFTPVDLVNPVRLKQ